MRPDAPADASATIEKALGKLRRLARRSLALRGFSILVVTLVAVALVSLGVDQFFRLSLATRVVALLVYAGIIAWVGWRLLLRPLLVKLPGPVLADLLERHFAELEDRVRSAVDFLRDPDLLSSDREGQDLTLFMKRRVTSEAAHHIERLDSGVLINTRAVVSAFSGSAVAMCVLVLAAVLNGEAFRTWFQRQILLADVEWPYSTKLVVEGFGDDVSRAVWRGDPLTLRVVAEGETPGRVTIRLDYKGDTARYNMSREGSNLNTFTYEHPAVTEPFHFTVAGGDFRSKPHEVIVLERPAVESLAITVSPPSYTREGLKKIESDIGELPIPTGSTIRLEGRANKALLRAWLETEEEESTTSGEKTKKIELAVVATDGERRRFFGAYKPQLGGLVTVRLKDEESTGFPETQGDAQDIPLSFSIHLREDRLPEVTMRVNGLGPLLITPQARMPLEVVAKDDYGVESLKLAWSLAADGAAEQTGEDPLVALEQPERKVNRAPVWEVSRLQAAPETRLSVRVGATDNDALSGAKTGYSGPRHFQIVTDERLLEDLRRREEEQRGELERITEKEKAVKDDVYTLLTGAWQSEEPLPEEVKERMNGLARIERQHATQLRAIAAAVQQILDEMENNRVGKVDHLRRLEDLIIGPLIQLATKTLPEAALALGRIRDAAEKKVRVDDGLRLATLFETKVETLEEIIANMWKLEGFTEIVKNLRAIITVQDEATRATQESYRKEIQTLFQPETNGGDGEK